jgi:hypothetical protein
LKYYERIIEQWGDMHGWEVAFPDGRNSNRLFLLRQKGMPFFDWKMTGITDYFIHKTQIV